MSRTKYDDTYSYEILENGYDIYKDERKIISQPEPYAKLFVPDGTYEDNAIAQIQQMETPPTPPEPTPDEILRSDVDFLALMEGVTLPSQEGE